MPVSDTVTKITASILVNITGVDALSLVLLETKTPEFSLIYTDSYLFMKEDREAFMSQVKIERKILDDLKIRLAFKLGSLKLKVRIADMQYLKTPVEYGDTLLLSFYAFLREDQLGKLFKPSYVIVPVQDVIVSKKRRYFVPGG